MTKAGNHEQVDHWDDLVVDYGWWRAGALAAAGNYLGVALGWGADVDDGRWPAWFNGVDQ